MFSPYAQERSFVAERRVSRTGATLNWYPFMSSTCLNTFDEINIALYTQPVHSYSTIHVHLTALFC